VSSRSSVDPVSPNPSKPAAAEAPPPAMQLMQLITGMWVSRCVYLAAKLGLADQVVNGAKSPAELAIATGTHAPSLYRLLRALASVGVFAEDAGGRFGLTPVAELLRSDAPGSLRWSALSELSDTFRACWGEAMHSLQTGEIAANKALGCDVWAYFKQHPDESEIFNRSMSGMTASIEPAVLKAYDFGGLSTLVDVGGGHGTLLAGILEEYPSLQGVVFDLPEVVEGATKRLTERGLSGRCKVASGSFFESVPAGADGYVMKFILHDWDDEQSRRILRNIRQSIRPGGRLLLVETVVPRDNAPHFGKLVDVHMMIMTGGRERTEAEWRSLLESTGFRLSRVVPTESGFSVIESRPV
jgi:SAM-dependent methyltransferase